MKSITFFAQKGGVGKTTLCLNLAAMLAAERRRVLVIDLDRNRSASNYVDAVVGFEASVAAALLGVCPLDQLLRPIVPNLWLAPGAPELALLETVTGVPDPERATPDGHLSENALAVELRRPGLATLDYVLIDCPGGHPYMERLALLASDAVIAVTGLSLMDLNAAEPALHQVLRAQHLRGGRPSFLGFLPNEVRKPGMPPDLQAYLEGLGYPWFTPVRLSAQLRAAISARRVEHRFIRSRWQDPAAQSLFQVAREIDLGIDAARRLPPFVWPLPKYAAGASGGHPGQ